MSVQIAMFEDDKDLADILQERLSGRNFVVNSYYSLVHKEWKKSDLVLADFRNKIVSFEELRRECTANGIPMIAISGMETGFVPQLIKPFTIEELESAILNQLMHSKRVINQTPEDKGFFKKLFSRK